jgi:hypothetical protein
VKTHQINVGIAALNPQAYDGSSTCHFQGSSCGTCYELQGPSGSQKIRVTDCCAGYVKEIEEGEEGRGRRGRRGKRGKREKREEGIGNREKVLLTFFQVS